MNETMNPSASQKKSTKTERKYLMMLSELYVKDLEQWARVEKAAYRAGYSMGYANSSFTNAIIWIVTIVATIVTTILKALNIYNQWVILIMAIIYLILGVVLHRVDSRLRNKNVETINTLIDSFKAQALEKLKLKTKEDK